MFQLDQFVTNAQESTERTYIYVVFGMLLVATVMGKTFKHLHEKMNRFFFLHECNTLNVQDQTSFETGSKTTAKQPTMKAMMHSSFASEIDGITRDLEAKDGKLTKSVRQVLVAHLRLAQSKNLNCCGNIVSNFLRLAQTSPSLLCYSLFLVN